VSNDAAVKTRSGDEFEQRNNLAASQERSRVVLCVMPSGYNWPMAIPKHIAALRSKIGHELLILPGVCGLVFDAVGRILLNRRSDTGRWAVLGGVIEPGEQPADAVVREVLEKTGVLVVPERITGVYSTPVMTLPNADQVQYVVTAFKCQAVSGEPKVHDDESLEVRYFDLQLLPELRPEHRLRIEHALSEGSAFFSRREGTR